MTIWELVSIFIVGALLGAYVTLRYALRVMDIEIERELKRRSKRINNEEKNNG